MQHQEPTDETPSPVKPVRAASLGDAKKAASHALIGSDSLSECSSADQNQVADDRVSHLRQKQKTLLDQSQRIEELESVLTCILYLTDKRKTLELENDV